MPGPGARVKGASVSGHRYSLPAMEAASTPDPRRWRALALVCVAFFMVVLDVSIVNVALPSVARDLELSPSTLQWIITAYSLAFGGFLLLGGRAADVLGRRRVFIAGMALFTFGSLMCGFAQSGAWLIAFRALQGLGGAIVSPATLSIINAAFRHAGAERNKAFGIWGAVAGSGAAVGVLLGGVLTEYLGWQWIFFVNVPVGIAIIALTSRLVSEGRAEDVDPHTDPLAALLATGGLVSFVYAMSRAPEAGWTSLQTIGLTILAVILITVFFVKEARTDSPLVPLELFRVRAVAVANLVGFCIGGAIFGGFFLLSLYMQQVLDYSPIQAGVAFLATAGTTIPAAGVAQALITRVGVKPVMAMGLALTAFAYLWYTQLPPDGTFWRNLFVPYVLSGVGLAFTFIPVSLAALANLEERVAGVASGLLNTSQQIGGALGVAIAATIANTHTKTLLAEGSARGAALTGGFDWAFWVGSTFAIVGLVVTLLILRRSDVPAVPAS
jgi:EmrB/QacA subfamily drug resistance transporter